MHIDDHDNLRQASRGKVLILHHAGLLDEIFASDSNERG